MDNHTDQSIRTMGKIMVTLAWILGLGLLTLFFARWEKDAYNPNTSPESWQDDNTRTVVLQRNRYHHYVTKGTINGEPVVFLLDTGATDVVIPETLAKRLRLDSGAKQYVSTANGHIHVYQTHLQQLTIGNITLYNTAASINPFMDDDAILLGMSALKNIEFTQKGDQLTLKQYR